MDEVLLDQLAVEVSCGKKNSLYRSGHWETDHNQSRETAGAKRESLLRGEEGKRKKHMRLRVQKEYI
jgi:hypothetical protein